jgi:hypothetical protein
MADGEFQEKPTNFLPVGLQNGLQILGLQKQQQKTITQLIAA